MNEEKEFKHFCDNPNCPNHNLELNYEKHYHSDDIISEAVSKGLISPDDMKFVDYATVKSN